MPMPTARSPFVPPPRALALLGIAALGAAERLRAQAGDDAWTQALQRSPVAQCAAR